MHYLLKPLWRALRHMNDRELKLSIIIGFLLFIAGLLDLLARSAI
jgi:Kef-type K+ transport system membrane component KefB